MQFFKKSISLLFAFCLVIGLMPSFAFAENSETEVVDDHQCICESPCVENDINSTCPFCGAAGADLAQCAGNENSDNIADAQDQIDSLPSPDDLRSMSQEELNKTKSQLQSAREAYNKLSNNEKSKISGADILEVLSTVLNDTSVENDVNLLANNEVAYIDSNGAQQSINAFQLVEAQDTEWSAGWYVVDSDVTIDHRTYVQGSVNLILKDNCKLTINGGIGMKEGSSFTIFGQENNSGELTIQNCSFGNAGIGSDNQDQCGDITINGGVITVAGGGNASGIGTGYYGAHCGDITINGGTVSASIDDSEDYLGTGIGSGYFNCSSGTLTINGGTITANGSDQCPGIGSGYFSSSDGITITGGIVTAIGGINGAGIGSGYFKYDCGPIIIQGGVIYATGGEYSYGIGKGSNNNEIDPSFSTGDSGNAVIFASSISNQSNKENWSGIIFEGSNGYVYGGSIAPTESFSIPEDKTLTIEKGKTFHVDAGISVKNNGQIINNGTINNNGQIINNGTINNDGEITGTNISGNQPSLTHIWGATVYTWSNDGKTCTATRTCKNDSSHTESAEATVISEQSKAPTCADSGETTYTATFDKDWAQTQTKTIADIPAVGHSWGDPVWSWSEDGKTATVAFTCQNDATHTETPEVTITSQVKTPATCTEAGVTAYAATAQFNGKSYTNTKDVADIPALGHKLNKTEAKAATCTESGNIEYWACDVCKKVFADADGKKEITLKSTVIPAIGHSYGDDGHCTVCSAVESDFVPEIIAGANATWHKGSGKDLSFTSNAAYDDFLKVLVDGEELDASNYAVEPGSTVISLKASYLETLSVGKHTLSIVSDTGTAESNFTVAADGRAADDEGVNDDSKESLAKTGDGSMLTITALSVIAAVFAAVGAFSLRRIRL